LKTIRQPRLLSAPPTFTLTFPGGAASAVSVKLFASITISSNRELTSSTVGEDEILLKIDKHYFDKNCVKPKEYKVLIIKQNMVCFKCDHSRFTISSLLTIFGV